MDDDDLLLCETCDVRLPIDHMISTGECWICPTCHTAYQEAFAACDHKWTPDVDEWGEPAHFCARCHHMVSDQDFPEAVGHAAPARPSAI